MLLLRSVLFTSYLFVSAFVGATLELLCFWAPFRVRWGIAYGWAAGCIHAGRILCGMRVVTEGAENLPPGPAVALIKHTTALETYWHVTVFPRTAWVVKRELLWIPLFGWAIALLLKPIGIAIANAGFSL